MKKRGLIVFFLLFIGVASAQKEAAIWYFGQGAGLDFNSGTPIALTDGALITQEGCTAISDFNGNLLLYSDGTTIWNRNHQPMPNGTGLLGHSSSTQSGIIVPDPGNPNFYYVFTVDQLAQSNGLQYNVVDMTLEGGLGDVITKNQLLEIPVTEKLTAVAHANGTDIWVLAHRFGSNDFVAYLVTSTGINTTPIVSSIGFVASIGAHTAGYMKLSPDGSLLASAAGLGNYLQLFNFDTATGIVSNLIDLSSFYTSIVGNNPAIAYGLDFSSDSSKMYVACSIHLNYPNVESRLYQFDLTNLNGAAIMGTAVLLSNQSIEIGGIQLGIDGKIYLAEYEQSYLGVINNPNVLGTAAGYVQNGISLSGKLSRYGLPPFIQSYFLIGLKAAKFCLGDATEFSITTNEPIISINWDFGDGFSSTVENPTHAYVAAGVYTVSVTATTATETKTESKDITIYTSPIANPVSDFEVCSRSTTYTFDLSTKKIEVLGAQLAADHTVVYYPSLLDAQNGTNPLPNLYANTNAMETIYVRIFNNNNPSCFATTNFDLLVKEAPVLNTIVSKLTACDMDIDGQFNFDLSQKDGEIRDGQLATIFSVYYFDNKVDALANTNALSTSYTNTTTPQEIFFRIENTNYPECFESASFFLKVVPLITANTISDFMICDTNNDGYLSFNLATKDAEVLGTQDPLWLNVSYHPTQLEADTATNALDKTTYTNTTAYNETLYVRIASLQDPNCYATTTLNLVVNDSPVLQIVTDWVVCDDDNDNRFIFDLTEKNMEILGSQFSADFTIGYYTSQADADTGQNLIVGIFENTVNPQQIFYRIENVSNTNCYLTNSFSLEIFNTPIANILTPIVSCDTEETGMQSFDLTLKDTEVLGGQDASSYMVSYFGAEADALANENALEGATYTNTSLQETIYVRVHHKKQEACFDTASFTLTINPLPQLDVEDVYVICPDSPELTIDAGDFETWSWKDENGNEIGTARIMSIVELGTYGITVTQTLNGLSCERTVSFQVVSSGAPDDFTTEISGFSDTVKVIIRATGVGEFEYSVDGEFYQESNTFEIFPGEYTVYVRDKFLCRVISKEITALGYQNFFTPNGDGINEYWNIIGAIKYPNSVLRIYDRYGKLLSELLPTSLGWDGKYNETPMPSSDYWFIYVYENGKSFKGHFTLKR